MNVPATRAGLRTMLRMETAWNAPWMLTSLTQQGLSHYRQGAPNMDSCRIGGVGPVSWLIVADGVGSKPNSHHGSNLAADTVDEHLRQALTAGRAPSRGMLKEAFAAAHAALEMRTRQLGMEITDYATTLSAAIVTEETVHAASIGDSSVVALCAPFAEGPGKLMPLSSAPQPKQKGATLSIANTNWEAFTAFNDTKAQPIKAVLLASDGGEEFYATTPPSGDTAFETQFLNAFDHALKILTPRAFCNFFSEYIRNNEAMNDDDRTILIAYRVPADLAPPPQVA